VSLEENLELDSQLGEVYHNQEKFSIKKRTEDIKKSAYNLSPKRTKSDEAIQHLKLRGNQNDPQVQTQHVLDYRSSNELMY
jgi:hypothetical protein